MKGKEDNANLGVLLGDFREAKQMTIEDFKKC